MKKVEYEGRTAASVAAEHTRPRTGVLFVLGFLLFANANAVFSGHLLQSVNPFVFLFWSFLATGLFFAVQLTVKGGFRSLSIRAQSALPLALLNTTTAVTWIGYYYALRFIEPAIVSALMGGLGPLCTIFLDRLIRHRRLPSLTPVAAIGILAGACLLAWGSLSGLSAVREFDTADTIKGLLAGAAGGLFQALNTVATKQLGDRQWRASEIMAHRFYLLVLVAGLLCATGPGFVVGTSAEVALLAIATVLGSIVPLWLLQRGILASEPFLVASLLSLAPIVAYVLQGFDSRLAWSATSGIGCVVVVLFTVMSTRANFSRSAS